MPEKELSCRLFKAITYFYVFYTPLIAYAMTKTGQLSYGSSDQVFPTLVRELLPSGIRGLVAGGLLAALMSSLSSVFNSCSTLFTMDIYKKLYPETNEKKLVFVGRIATGIVVLSGILWIPLRWFPVQDYILIYKVYRLILHLPLLQSFSLAFFGAE